MSTLREFHEKKCVEPKKRWVGGEFTWAVHRFPIKNGITLKEAMRLTLIEQMYHTRSVMWENLLRGPFNG